MHGFAKISPAIPDVLILLCLSGCVQQPEKADAPVYHWVAPDTASIPRTAEGDMIRYGRDLIANTSYYLGPSGKVAQITNGMNCQNCHLEAGTKSWGNNYSAVASTYPRFRARSGMKESIEKRINDCIERSLNGHALNANSRELRAIVAYMLWLGKDVPKSITPEGSGLVQLSYMTRAADPWKGSQVYAHKCQRCHGMNGEGQLAIGASYLYPPLWGAHSYNTGAGLYRLSRFARYVKHNMPFDIAYGDGKLTDEEAWDVAAYVNSQPRPAKHFREDWPDISAKPADHPFGPFADTFTEEQHKYGPFGPIAAAQKEYAGKKKQVVTLTQPQQ